MEDKKWTKAKRKKILDDYEKYFVFEEVITYIPIFVRINYESSQKRMITYVNSY